MKPLKTVLLNIAVAIKGVPFRHSPERYSIKNGAPPWIACLHAPAVGKGAKEKGF